MFEYYDFKPLTDNSKSFAFKTKNNISYNVFFNPYYQLTLIAGEEIQNVYQLSLEKLEGGIEPFDKKVSKTVEFVIYNDFFSNSQNILLYVSSN